MPTLKSIAHVTADKNKPDKTKQGGKTKGQRTTEIYHYTAACWTKIELSNTCKSPRIATPSRNADILGSQCRRQPQSARWTAAKHKILLSRIQLWYSRRCQLAGCQSRKLISLLSDL